MLAQTSIQSGSFRSTFGSFRALAAASIITGFGMSDLTARTVVYPLGQTVNRALKGDLLPLAPAIRRNAGQHHELQAPRISAPHSNLPDGCEGLVSSITNSDLANIAGRCVS
jgi:hypothetical protein